MTARRVLLTVVRLYLTLCVPLLLALVSARLVMTSGYLWLEYHRPGFPEDVYGFTLEDRLRHAPYAVEYLLNGADIRYLGDLRFADGDPLFTDRELRHMVDVKAVTQGAFAAALIGGLAALGLGYLLARDPATRPILRRALRDGAVATLGLIASIVVVAVAAWNTFFTLFHRLFFADGTWQFLYSDTLIRLFPEQFWFDTALVIGGLMTVGALGILLTASKRMRGPRASHAG